MKQVICIILLILFSVTASAGVGTDPSSYLQADWTREDYTPTDGLISDWQFLDAMVEGDLLQGAGDMESGSTVGACTYCPTGFSACVCSGTSTMTQETLMVYKNNSALKITVDAGASFIGIGRNGTFEANAAYQISFRYKGVIGGTEDLTVYIANGTGTDFYNFATDAWQVAGASMNYNNMPSTWSTATIYVTVGPITKVTYDLVIYGSGASEAFLIDDFQIRKLKSTGPRSRAGQYTLSVPVTSDMRFGDSPNLLSKPADGPAGSWGTSFDGVDDFVGCTDASCGSWTVPLDSFSAAIELQRDSITNGQGYIGKYAGGAESWMMYSNALDLNAYFRICNIVGSCASVTVTPVSPLMNHSIIGTYKIIANATSIMTAYLDNIVPVNRTDAPSPVADTNADFLIGAFGYLAAPSYPFPGKVKRAALYSKELDSIGASKWINPYFPANNNNRGSYVTTCTQAASHATCSATKCRDGTPNACQAEATGAEAIFGQQIELVPYNSFETVVGDDSNPVFTGWTIVNIAGDGTATTTIYRDETKHGNIAVRMKSSGSTAANISTSNCIPVTPLATYYPYLSGKQLGGSRSNLYLNVNSYSDGACANYVSAASVRTSSISSVFEVLKPFVFPNGVTVGAGTNSVTIQIVNYGSYAGAAPTFTGTASSDILIDAVSFKAATYFTPWVHNPGAGTTTYNARDYRIRNTLADQTYAGTYPYLTGWCGGVWIYTDWSGTDAPRHDLLYIPPTAGANNLVGLLTVGGVMYFYIYDSAGAYKVFQTFLDANNWYASNWKYLEACTSNTGTLKGHYYNVNNSTWYNLGNGGGAGTGIQNGQNTLLFVGSNTGANQTNGYISQLCFKPYNAIYPNCGFNGGKPPFLAATYPPI